MKKYGQNLLRRIRNRAVSVKTPASRPVAALRGPRPLRRATKGIKIARITKTHFR